MTQFGLSLRKPATFDRDAGRPIQHPEVCGA